MEFKAFETIQKRISVRTYESRQVEKEKQELMCRYLAGNTRGPFGSSVRFALVDAGESAGSLKKYVSYGNIKGGRLFIAGAVAKGARAMEDFGYAMEKNILMAASLGLGTVWLGGSLNRSAFARALHLSDDESIPAITPVGYAADKPALMDRLLKTLSGGKSRKPFGEIFFDGDFSKNLNEEGSGAFRNALEAVRLAPSAQNKQPWRVVRDKDEEAYHFYLEESLTNTAIQGVRLQLVDMGIAMCHFEMTAREESLKGSWIEEKPAVESGRLIYVVSWRGQ